MTGDYTRRLLPLLDVMMLLFGLMIILLLSANFSPASPGATATSISPAALTEAKSENLLSELLGGKPIVFLEVTADTTVQHILGTESSGSSLGKVDQFNEVGFKQLVTDVGKGEEDVPIIVFYLPGLESREFTPERQATLLKQLGEDRTFYTRKPTQRKE
jgi:hypothetical protein